MGHSQFSLQPCSTLVLWTLRGFPSPGGGMLNAVLISKPSSLKACYPLPQPGGWERAS